MAEDFMSTKPAESPKKTVKLENKKKSTIIKLANKNEGRFAFNSEEDLMQPFYPLKFEEYDLAAQMKKEEAERKLKSEAANSKRRNAMKGGPSFLTTLK